MSGEKNLPATEHHIEKAREDGQVASSQDLMKSVVCISVFEGCRYVFTRYHHFAVLYFQGFIDQIGLIRDGSSFNGANVFVWLFGAVAVSVALSSVAVLVWLATSWIQTSGPVFKKNPIEFKLDKLDPSKFFKNIFSAKTVIDFVGNLIKAAVISLVFGQAVKHAIRDAPMALPRGIEAVATLIGAEVLGAVRIALLALLCLAVFDFWVQHRLMLRNLKMSFEEVKKENKEMQGNPEIKQHMRRLGHEILSADGEPAADPLAGSNALIVNPTHLAVGLRYIQGEKRLPQIRVKASDAEAMDLIEIARNQNVPVIRHIWLARTLYALAEGEAIPREAFKTVAAVYRMLFQLDLDAAKEATAAKSAHMPFAADPLDKTPPASEER